MKLALRIVILHLAASMTFLLAGHLGDHLVCCGILFVSTHLATIAFFMINLPGVLVARAVLTYSINHTLGQEIAYAAVMIPSTEAILVSVILVVRRALRRAV